MKRYRRNFRRRRNYRSKRFGRRNNSRFRKSVRKTVYQMQEKKFMDYPIDSGVSITGFAVDLLQQIAQGPSRQQRIGNRVSIRWILPRLTFFSNGEDLMFARMAIVRARTAGLNATAFPSGANAQNSFMDIERFEVLFDKTWSLGDSDTDGRNKLMCKTPIKIMKSAMFDTGAINSLLTLNLWVWFWTSDIVTTGSNVQGQLRIYFNDV